LNAGEIEMSTANATPQTTAGDAGLGGLSGLELWHDLYVVLPNWFAWGAVAEALSCAGAELQSVQLLHQPGGFSGRCRLRNVSSEEARRLPALLIESGVARQASVEHLMLRAGAAP
jgi:hypothetical protein